jgi:hypothetical protein
MNSCSFSSRKSFSIGNLRHDEAFRVVNKKDRISVEYQDPAGALYGAQAVIDGDYKEGGVSGLMN